MSVQIVLNQAAQPPGNPGFARQDFLTGVAVSAAAVGGPYFQYLWTLIDKPLDLTVPARSTAVVGSPTSTSTLVSPIDMAGTYLLELLVDSGSGLGATQDDVARITFYANSVSMPLNADPAEAPRRTPAFRETTEHNVPETLFPGGNPRGWAEERLRFDEMILRMYQGKSWAHGRVDVAGGGPATVVDGMNVASATWAGTGLIDVVFTRPLQNNLYTITGNTYNAPGFFYTTNRLNTGFRAVVTNPANAAADLAFCFNVQFNPFTYQ
jgi:hypothetical protein